VDILTSASGTVNKSTETLLIGGWEWRTEEYIWTY